MMKRMFGRLGSVSAAIWENAARHSPKVNTGTNGRNRCNDADQPATGKNISCKCGLLHWPDWLPSDDKIVEIKMDILIGYGPLTAMINIDPHFLDLERVDVTEADVGLFKSDLSVDPAAKNTVILAATA